MGHTYTKLLYHIIFAVAERRPVLGAPELAQLASYTGGILRQLNGTLLEYGGPDDHVHLLTTLPTTISLADAMRQIKRSSSVWISKQGPSLRDFHWQEGYAAFTVSSSGVEQVQRYIRGQVEHHKERTFDEELEAFLERHGIEPTWPPHRDA